MDRVEEVSAAAREEHGEAAEHSPAVEGYHRHALEQLGEVNGSSLRDLAEGHTTEASVEEAIIVGDTSDGQPVSTVSENARSPDDVIVIDSPAPAASGSSEEGCGEADGGAGAVSSPATQKKRPRDANDGVVPEDAANCSICYEAWSSEGAHRVASLKCGHLFGASCIAKWLKQSAKCPQCNQRAHRADIRAIYTPCVVSVDNSTVLEAQRRAEEERQRCRQAEEGLEKMKTYMAQQIVALKRDLRTAHSELAKLKKNVGSSLGNLQASPVAGPSSRAAGGGTPVGSGRPAQMGPGVKCFRVPTKQSRSMDLSLPSRVALVSETSASGAHSLRKVSLVAPTASYGIALQPGTGVVKDIRLNASGSQALVAAMGSHPLQVINVHNSTVIANLPLPVGAWSCAWALESEHKVYAGLQYGQVAVFDLRRVQVPIALLGTPGSQHPLHTVLPVEENGCKLLTASIGGVHAWELQQATARGAEFDVTELQAHRLTNGVGTGGQPCISVAASPQSTDYRTVVATFRSAANAPPYHHVVRGILQSREEEDQDEEGEGEGEGEGTEEEGGVDGGEQTGGGVGGGGGISSGGDDPIAGYRLVGRLGGHSYSTSAQLCRTCIISPLGASGRYPYLACPDAATRQVWLWDLEDGSIVKRLPQHTSPILSVRSSFDRSSGRVAIASLSEASLCLSVLDQDSGALVH